MTLKQLRQEYPHGAHQWLNELAHWLIKFKVFEMKPLNQVRDKLDIRTWLDTYYMECYSAKDAVIEDMNSINN